MGAETPGGTALIRWVKGTTDSDPSWGDNTRDDKSGLVLNIFRK